MCVCTCTHVCVFWNDPNQINPNLEIPLLEIDGEHTQVRLKTALSLGRAPSLLPAWSISVSPSAAGFGGESGAREERVCGNLSWLTPMLR